MSGRDSSRIPGRNPPRYGRRRCPVITHRWRCTRSSPFDRRGSDCGQASPTVCRGRLARCAGRARCRSTGSIRRASSPTRAAGRSPPSCTIGRSSAPSPCGSPTPTATATAACSCTEAAAIGWPPTATTACPAGSARSPAIDVDDVIFTGSHEASLEALASGDADMAMIDALTLAHLRRLSTGADGGPGRARSRPVDPQPGDRRPGDDAGRTDRRVARRDRRSTRRSGARHPAARRLRAARPRRLSAVVWTSLPSWPSSSP